MRERIDPTLLVLLMAAALPAAIAAPPSKDLSAEQWLGQVPAMPSDPRTAYQQWTDNGHAGLTPGPQFQALQIGIAAYQRDQAQGAGASPGQVDKLQALKAEYGTPEGQAKLRSMSLADQMAIAQQIQAATAMPAPGAVSPHDQTLLRKIAFYPDSPKVDADLMKLQQQKNVLAQAWHDELDKLIPKQEAERRTLKGCGGEAGMPSSAALEEFELRYADQRIAIASQYLGKLSPVVAAARKTLEPRIGYGDGVLAAWSQLEDPAMKQRTSAEAHGVESASLGDVATYQEFVKDASRPAAQAVADRKAIERKYLDAKGCS